jgi:predicted negative regulator of RcsB-dependent stress response
MPGWDSLQTVAQIHGAFEVLGLALLLLLAAGGVAAYFGLRAGIFPDQLAFAGVRLRGDLVAVAIAAVLALLVGAQILAYGYGQRKDMLAEAAVATRAQQALKPLAAREARNETEVAKLHQLLRDAERNLKAAETRLNAAEARIGEFERAQARKRLSEEEKNMLIAALKPFAGQRVTVASIRGDEDGKAFAEDVVAVFEAAGWDHGGDAGIVYRQWDRDPVGIEVTLNEDDGRAGRISEATRMLINVVREFGLGADNTVYLNGEVPEGAVEVRVGRKLRK